MKNLIFNLDFQFTFYIVSLLSAISATTAVAAGYPEKPIRLVTVEAGGSSDFVTRIIALGLTEQLGKQVVVDNRGGASGLIAKETVARALPDGYTLLLDSTALWILPLMRPVPYHVLNDYAPISLTDKSPGILVVHPSVPATTVKELIALAKAKPGQYNYATGLPGSSNHLAAELFMAMTNVNFVQINYKGAGPALVGLLSGEAQVMFPSSGSVASQLKSGRLKALAVTSSQQSALTPDLPTIAASGVPGYKSESAHALFAPANTPKAIIDRLHREVVVVLARSEVQERLLNAGIESVGSSPSELTQYIKSEMAQMGKIIKAAKIKVD